MPQNQRRNLWLIRLYYLTWLGGGGFLLPYMGLYFIAQNLSGTEIGLISTIVSITTLIAAPIWGRWNDQIEHPRRLLQAALLATAIIYLLISQQKLFGWLALLYAIHGLVSAGLGPLSDTLALGTARDAGYGSIRLWGSLGWAVVVLISGLLIDEYGLMVAFIGYIATLIVAIMIVNGLAVSRPAGSDTPIKVPRASMKSMVRELLSERALVGLAVALSILGLMTKGVATFESIYLDELGASTLIIGLTSTITATVEIPAMLWADRLVTRYSAGSVLRAGIALQAVRMLMITLMPTIPVILAMRVIEGFAFGFYAISLVVYIGRRAPSQQVGVVMALYTVTLAGLINIIAGPLGGLIYDWIGAYWLYAVALTGDVAAWLVLTIMHRPPRRPEYR